MRFNLNHYVRVKLTPLGHDLIVKNHNELFGEHAHRYAVRRVEEDDGWSKWQMWDLMAEFGRHLGNGRPLPFETEIEIIEEKVA